MILDKFKLDDKVAIVTGSSRGLGQGMAIALAEAGADIVLVDRSDATALCQAVGQRGRRCLNLTADLSDATCVADIVQSAVEKFGAIDILVNNAGIIRRAPLLEFPANDWDEVININLRTLFFLSQAVARVMVEQGRGGKIINVASLLSFQGGILVPAYTAAKSAVKGLTHAFANELARHNINVNAIAPGYMATDNTKALREDAKRSAEILARIPASRWGTPDDLMGTVVFLASQASNYVHGHTLVVDGGWMGR